MLGISMRRNSDDDILVTSEVGNQLLELAGLASSTSARANSRSTAGSPSDHADGDRPASHHSGDPTAQSVENGGGGKVMSPSTKSTSSNLTDTIPKVLPAAVKPSMSSQNYEDNESEVARLYEVEQHQGGDGDDDEATLRARTRKRALIRWIINLLMAVVIESIYLFISYSSSTLLQSKAYWVLHSPTPFTKYLTKLSFSLLYAAIAFLMVFLVPTSAGSGIPETKAFLNGIRIPNMQSLRTLTAKVLGTIFAVSAGLPLGKYGPMIHIGSIVAAFMSRGARGIKQVDRLFESFRIFSTHTEKRDLVVSGAAAGVTAAFGAPIGGLMLAWEEGSSYWSLKVSWRVFFCAMATLLFTYMVAESKALRESKFLNQTYIQSYAGSFSTGIKVENRDLIIFAFMGIVGGILGASFNNCHKFMSAFRARHVATWNRKFMEVQTVTFMVVTISFIAAYFSESWACRPIPPKDPALYQDGTYATSYLPGLLKLTCPKGHYNEMATLYMNDGVTALRLIFHLPRINPATGALIFTNQALLLFVLPYFVLMISTFGIAVPSGFFVPQLLVGATLGRLFCEVLINAGWPTYFGQARIFAIMGSAAFVGGISRMVLSMTVIMLEATGDLFFLLPFAIVLIVSHWVGDMFNPSIYEMIIQMKNYPFLRPDPPKWAIGVLRASDLMTRNVATLRPIEQVKVIREMLYKTEHNMYPCIYQGGPKNQALFGTVMRETLVVLMQAGAFSTTSQVDTDPDCPDTQGPVLDYPTLLKHASRLSSRQVARPIFHISEEEDELWIDLRPYSNPSIYYVTEDSSVTKVYRVFRGLGLRHLLVLDNERHISGVIARYDLMPNTMRQRLADIKGGKREQVKSSWSLPSNALRRRLAPRIVSQV